VSPKARLRFGFKDGRAEIGVKPGILPRVWFTIAGEDLPLATDALRQALEWAGLPEDRRKAEGAE
jgi:hypothetical protein